MSRQIVRSAHSSEELIHSIQYPLNVVNCSFVMFERVPRCFALAQLLWTSAVNEFNTETNLLLRRRTKAQKHRATLRARRVSSPLCFRAERGAYVSSSLERLHRIGGAMIGGRDVATSKIATTVRIKIYRRRKASQSTGERKGLPVSAVATSPTGSATCTSLRAWFLRRGRLRISRIRRMIALKILTT